MNKNIVLAPRLGTNDDCVTVGSWLVDNGEKVSEGQVVVSLETSKEINEFETKESGYIFYTAEEGEEIPVGTELFVISDDPKFKLDKKEDNVINQNITVKAKTLMKKYNIDPKDLPKLDLIREADILNLISDKTDTQLVSNTQKKTARSNDIIIMAGGGLSKMCIDLIRKNKAYNILGIIDPSLKVDTEIMGVKVIGKDEDLSSLYNDGYRVAVNAIGSITAKNKSKEFSLRKDIFDMLKEKNFFMPTLIHPSAQIATSAELGEGNLVFENAVIGSDANIGNNCIINTNAVVSHDCEIGDDVRLSPGAILAGNVTVGDNTLIGMGVTVYIGVKIGKNVVIPNGANVFSDIPDNVIFKE